nr:hypothetical protein [Chloroflexota bacterium]
MPEILTESFCERCGTRYTFESAAPRVRRLKGVKVISRGLKNFVLSDSTSMNEAMASARSERDREISSQQLDAFHNTFSFCMSCRQYTCGGCWNDFAGRCLSCEPAIGQELLTVPMNGTLDGLATDGADDGDGTNLGGHAHDLEPISTDGVAAASSVAGFETDREAVPDRLDLEPPIEAGGSPQQTTSAPPLVAVDATADVRAAAPDLDPDFPIPVLPDASIDLSAVDAPLAPAAKDQDLDGRAAAAAAQTSTLFRRFRPGQNLDDAIDAYEREHAPAGDEAFRFEAVPQVEIEAATPEVEAVTPEVETATPVVEVEAATPEVEAVAPEVKAVEPEVEAVAANGPVEERQGHDVVTQPTWQIIAPDLDQVP